MESKHIKELLHTHWHIKPDEGWGAELTDQRGEVHANFTMATPEALKLIESAPDMLRALKRVKSELGSGPVTIMPDDNGYIDPSSLLGVINLAIESFEGTEVEA